MREVPRVYDASPSSAGDRASSDFICIGAQKAGTSWFDTMLRQHRGLFLPPMKEIHFFDFIYMPEHRHWIRTSFNKHMRRQGQRSPVLKSLLRPAGGDPAASGRVVPGGLRASGLGEPGYRRGDPRLFAAARRGGRASAGGQPGMKVIFILRDPVDRALSHLRMAANRRRSDHVGSDWFKDERASYPRCWPGVLIARTSPAGRRSFPQRRSSTCPTAGSDAPRSTSCGRWRRSSTSALMLIPASRRACTRHGRSKSTPPS